jgi:hypothetical protein
MWTCTCLRCWPRLQGVPEMGRFGMQTPAAAAAAASRLFCRQAEHRSVHVWTQVRGDLRDVLCWLSPAMLNLRHVKAVQLYVWLPSTSRLQTDMRFDPWHASAGRGFRMSHQSRAATLCPSCGFDRMPCEKKLRYRAWRCRNFAGRPLVSHYSIVYCSASSCFKTIVSTILY